MSDVFVPDFIKTLKPYRSGNMIGKKASREEFRQLINLASNENPLGISPRARQAIMRYVDECAIYPDPGAKDLVETLSDRLGIAPGRIVTGAGSDSLLQYIFNAFTREGDEILTASGTFIGTFVNINKLGRKLVTVPLKNYGFDLDGILAGITERTRVIYIANPNNPTGMMVGKDELGPFLDKVPAHIIVVLDEAYSVYAEEFEDYPDGLKYGHGNLIVLRTLSKCYGLAGIRVGYAVGPEDLVGYIYRVKLPFEPNVLAQRAAAAALDDLDFLEETISTNRRNLKRITDFFDGRGIARADAKANFVMVVFDSEEKAAGFTEGCLDHGIIVRHLPMFGLPEGVRINSGTDEQTDKALDVFSKVLEQL